MPFGATVFSRDFSRVHVARSLVFYMVLYTSFVFFLLVAIVLSVLRWITLSDYLLCDLQTFLYYKAVCTAKCED
jgi:hypothetical protein